MDIPSYLLGKNSASGGESGETYFANDLGRAYSTNATIQKLIKKIPSNLVGQSNISYAFKSLDNLETVEKFDTSNVHDMSYLCMTCGKLVNFPELDVSNVDTSQGFKAMFSNTLGLSDESINNVLNMCIKAVNYPGTKTLAELGFDSSRYKVARIQALPSYDDFIAAGWTIGY